MPTPSTLGPACEVDDSSRVFHDYETGTADLTDEAFIDAMEGLWLDKARFRHFDHIRLAWLYLARESLPAASDRFVATLRTFAVHHLGDERKYHHTITQAFMLLVADARAHAPCDESFGSFVTRCSWLFDKTALLRYYSVSVLMSAEAREGWVGPDRRPLPSLLAPMARS